MIIILPFSLVLGKYLSMRLKLSNEVFTPTEPLKWVRIMINKQKAKNQSLRILNEQEEEEEIVKSTKEQQEKEKKDEDEDEDEEEK